MNLTYILTMVLMVSSPGISQTPALTTITAEYRNQELCQKALQTNRIALSGGKVILATCTQKDVTR